MTDTEKYQSLAKYYDKIYEGKDYQADVNVLNELISKYKRNEGIELLDIACGTGSHINFLREKYSCTGVDLNPGMLEVAKEKYPEVHFEVADMTKLNLEKQFDIITCLLSSIGYLLTKENVTLAIKGFAKHLKPGGIVLIELWLSKEIFRAGEPHITTYKDSDLIITRVNTSKVQGDISTFDMHYLVAERGKEVEHFVEHHELAMFPKEFFVNLMKENDLEIHQYDEGIFYRGLVIGVKK